MLAGGVKALTEELAKLKVGRAVEAAEDLDVLERELEGRGLEADVAGRVGEHEAEVDVDEVPVAVEEDVAVVPVLDLQQVRHERVARERLGEVALRPCELGGRRIAIGLRQVVSPRGKGGD